MFCATEDLGTSLVTPAGRRNGRVVEPPPPLPFALLGRGFFSPLELVVGGDGDGDGTKTVRKLSHEHDHLCSCSRVRL